VNHHVTAAQSLGRHGVSRLATRSALSFAALGLCSLAVVTLAACSSGSTSSPSPSSSAGGAALEGKVWKATEIAGVSALVEDAQVTAEFNAGTVSGSGGVNSYSATYTVTDPSGITISQPAATLMAGPEKAMDQEAAYFAAFTKATTFAVTADTLTLSDDAGNELVRYAVLEPTALEGTDWQALAYNNGKGALQSLAADSEITALFGADGSLSGNASVNSYSTTYTASGENMAISGQIVTTKMAGPDKLMRQEAAYLAALPKTATYSVEGDELWLRDAEGAALAHYRAQ
jgi:heat shock protein HslJ